MPTAASVDQYLVRVEAAKQDALAIDLKNVSLVDGDAAQLLALAESNGTELKNCPKYIREWVNRERAASHGEN